MKKLFYRLSSRWTLAKIFSLLAIGALIFFVSDRAYAQPPVFGDGGEESLFKQLATGQKLVCDFNDARSTLLITEIESPPSFTMETPPGKVIICWEQVQGTGQRGPDIAFTLKQLVMTPNDGGANGLVVRSVNNQDGTRTVTWEFIVDNKGGADTEVLEWRLTPVDPANARDAFGNLICADPANPMILLNPCVTRQGVPLKPQVSDFPDRDVNNDNVPDFGMDGVVFRYTELVKASGTRLPKDLLFGPCHSGSFVVTDLILCERVVSVGKVKEVHETRTAGDIPGVVPVEVRVPNTINMSQTSGQVQIRICGEATLNPPPVATLVINGMSMAFTKDPNNTGSPCNSGFNDFVATVNRLAFIQALTCSNGLTRVVVTGTFTSAFDSTPFRGEQTSNCN